MIKILKNTLYGLWQKKEKSSRINVYFKSQAPGKIFMLLLIIEIDNTGSFFVLFTENSELVDVLARTLNGQLAKCIKRDGSQMELSSVSDATNGYQCGHEFFSDEMLQDALQIAQETTSNNLIYPAIYRGNLFPGNDEYKMWPILKSGKLYRSGLSI